MPYWNALPICQLFKPLAIFQHLIISNNAVNIKLKEFINIISIYKIFDRYVDDIVSNKNVKKSKNTA